MIVGFSVPAFKKGRGGRIAFDLVGGGVPANRLAGIVGDHGQLDGGGGLEGLLDGTGGLDAGADGTWACV